MIAFLLTALDSHCPRYPGFGPRKFSGKLPLGAEGFEIRSRPLGVVPQRFTSVYFRRRTLFEFAACLVGVSQYAGGKRWQAP